MCILYCADRSLANKLSLDGEAEENLLEAADDNIGPVLQVGTLVFKAHIPVVYSDPRELLSFNLNSYS